MSASLSGKSLLVGSVLVCLCAVNALDIGHTVVVPVGVGLGQLRAGRGYKMHLRSRFLKLSHASTVTESIRVLLFFSFFISCLPDGLTFLEVVSSH